MAVRAALHQPAGHAEGDYEPQARGLDIEAGDSLGGRTEQRLHVGGVARDRSMPRSAAVEDQVDVGPRDLGGSHGPSDRFAAHRCDRFRRQALEAAIDADIRPRPAGRLAQPPVDRFGVDFFSREVDSRADNCEMLLKIHRWVFFFALIFKVLNMLRDYKPFCSVGWAE